MLKILLAALLAFSAQSAHADEANSSCFLGLNDADSPATLNPCESTDLINTESNLDGTAIIKRKGYQLSASLTVSTAPVSGSHSFIDGSGNRQDIVCQDHNCAHSVNGNSFSVFLTTATDGTTRWSFVDVGGVLYGANNKHDKVFSYTGTTLLYPSGIPQGSILELTQDRMAVGDISGQPNRVHYSSAGAYSEFAVGVNPEDSYYDDFGASGDRVRGIKCAAGNCFIFKSASITMCEMADQYNTQCAVISPDVGTTDPSSIVAAGTDLYFRGQDKNFWGIDRSGLHQISKKIPNLVKSQSGGLAGGDESNTQTSKADWDAGAQSPTGSWDTATTNGSIFPSSHTLTDNTTASFVLGTMTAVTTNTVPGYLALARATFSFANGNLSYQNLTNWSYNGVWTYEPTISDSCGFSLVGIDTASGAALQDAVASYPAGNTHTISVYGDSGALIKSCSITTTCTSPTAPCKYASSNCDIIGDAAGQYLSGVYGLDTSTFSDKNISIRESDSFSSSIQTMYALRGDASSLHLESIYSGTSGKIHLAVTSCGIPNYKKTGSYLSRTFDTDLISPTWGILHSTYSGSSDYSNVAFYTSVTTSPNNDLWTPYVSSSDTYKILSNNYRYIKYKADFSSKLSTLTPTLEAIGLGYASTGTFTNQCIQPNTSISAWGTLSCAETKSGAGSLVYYATSAVSCATLPAGDPTTWQTSFSNNATVTIATNTAVKIGWRSLLGSATDQAQVDACTLSWNEGTPSQQSWAVYDSVRNAIYWTSTINGASATNRLLKYDLNLGYWYPFDISAQAPIMINNSLYFGGASAGTWNLYGGVDSDAGGAINAYWKSKDIGSSSPFQEKSFKTLSIMSRNQITGTMTGTWTLSNAHTGSYSISLSTGSGIYYARSNYNLPLTSPQQFINIKVGNNSAIPFEVLGMGVTWDVSPWRVSGP